MKRFYRRPRASLSDYEGLLRDVAEAEGITMAAARAVLEQFISRLPGVVWAKGRLVIPNLGAFRVRTRKDRRIRNPQTRELMHLPRVRVVAVRVSNSWRSRG